MSDLQVNTYTYRNMVYPFTHVVIIPPLLIVAQVAASTWGIETAASRCPVSHALLALYGGVDEEFF